MTADNREPRIVWQRGRFRVVRPARGHRGAQMPGVVLEVRRLDAMGGYAWIEPAPGLVSDDLHDLVAEFLHELEEARELIVEYQNTEIVPTR